MSPFYEQQKTLYSFGNYHTKNSQKRSQRSKKHESMPDIGPTHIQPHIHKKGLKFAYKLRFFCLNHSFISLKKMLLLLAISLSFVNCVIAILFCGIKCNNLYHSKDLFIAIFTTP